jgi:hypothetical protein
MSSTYNKIQNRGATVKGYLNGSTGFTDGGGGGGGGCSCSSLWGLVGGFLTPVVSNTVRVSHLVVTTAFSITSDITRKTDIEDITAIDLDKLSLLSGKSYSLISSPTTTRYGYIAQEMERVYPNLVYTDQTGLKTIDYIGIIPMITEKIKELDDKIANLKQ